MSVDLINRRSIILASASPRRHQLVSGLGINFSVMVREVDEVWPADLRHSEIPEYLAVLKADAFVTEELPEDYILITADTVVFLNGRVLGKPENREHAIAILNSLQGERHEVITAVCLTTSLNRILFHVSSDVWFRPIEEPEIIWYVDHYQPYDKAGAYGVQEWIGYAGIEKINGSFFNVMGLPTQRLYLELLSLIRKEEQ